MVTDNLLEFLNDFQKFALKTKVQNILDTLVKDDRVHEIIDADKVFDYYNKMHEEFARNPHNFLFPNREWLQDSLKRLNIDMSEIFDVDANVDHIKREEIIVLFILLWIHMKIQDPDSSSDVKTPYDLFIMWIYDRVFIARPTDARYLQDGDWKVLDHIYDKYGWFTKSHCFTIGAKGAVEYHHSSPDDITNIDGAYNKAHGSVTKLRSEKKTPLVWHHDIEAVSIKVPKDIQERIPDIDFDDFEDIIGKLANDVLEEEQRRYKIARNTKFVVREMTGYSNTSYKILLEDYCRTKFDKPIDLYIKEIVDALAEYYVIDLDSDFIAYAKKNATAKPDSPFQTVAIIDIINAMIKLKEKTNEEKDQ